MRFIVFTAEQEVVTYKHVLEADSAEQAVAIVGGFASGAGAWVGTLTSDVRVVSVEEID